jgi:hypothetical protein
MVRRYEVENQFVPLGEGAGWEQVQYIQNTSETHVHKITSKWITSYKQHTGTLIVNSPLPS